VETPYGHSIPAFEHRANLEAQEALVPQTALVRFIKTYKPYFSTTRINNLATELEIHPGVIVGQLQHRKEVGYNTHREAMVKVRELVTLTAFTDGWGHPLPQANYFKEVW
jgi:HTH-type transcriptional regulator/antitoxin HigA